MRAAVLALLLAASPAGAQGLTEGLPRVFEDASRVMTERLQALVPPGTPVAELRALLDAEGFEPEGDTAARRERRGFVCRSVWLVRWTEDGGRVATIEGEAGGVCL